jgi:hypothetical protein
VELNASSQARPRDDKPQDAQEGRSGISGAHSASLVDQEPEREPEHADDSGGGNSPPRSPLSANWELVEVSASSSGGEDGQVPPLQRLSSWA